MCVTASFLHVSDVDVDALSLTGLVVHCSLMMMADGSVLSNAIRLILSTPLPLH